MSTSVEKSNQPAAGPLPLQDQAAGDRPRHRTVTIRSVLIGLIGACFICALTPFNDYVLGNTFLVGNFLPIGLLLFMLVVIVLNAPLNRFAPRWALSTGELALALSMTMVSCALPSSGLMRYLPSGLVSIYDKGAANAEYSKLLDDMHLPEWIFPKTTGSTTAERAKDDVVRHYIARVPDVDDNMMARLKAVPWKAWETPAVRWGILVAGMFGGVMCLSVLVRHQWAENERLAFPLANVYMSLIEAPPKGKWFNGLFSARGFWIAFVLVFFAHSLNALYQYWPKYSPKIPLSFDMNAIYTNEPWKYASYGFKAASVYFCIVGFTFFIQTKIAFSLWFTYILVQIGLMAAGSMQQDMKWDARADQTMGAMLPVALSVLWVGRQQWMTAFRHMIGGRRAGEERGRYLPDSVAGWGFLACCATVIIWLHAAGATWAGGIVILIMVMLFFLVVARIVAETGLVFVQINTPISRVWTYGAFDMRGLGVKGGVLATTPATVYHSSFFSSLFANDMREALPVYATNSLRLGDLASYDDEKRSSRTLGFFGALLLAVVVGYIVAGASMLYQEYTYATMVGTGQGRVNPYGFDVNEGMTLGTTNKYVKNLETVSKDANANLSDGYSRLQHFAFGAAVTTVMSIGRLRFVNWPLHPVGFLLVYSFPMERVWFSIFIGWLAKVLVVKFGGIDLFRAARTFFIGLIVGEASVAAFWLLVSIARFAMGLEFHPVNLLPT